MSDEVTREAIIAAAEKAVAAEAPPADEPAEPLEAAPEPESVAAQAPAPEPTATDKIGTIIRAKRDAQRIKLDAQRERDEVAKQKAEFEALKAKLRENPLEALKQFGLSADDVSKQALAENTPEAELIRLRKEIEAERTARQTWQEQLAARERTTAEQAFVSVASKHPTLSALYADEPQELINRAYAVQQAYYDRTGTVPTREEIAEYLEEVETRRYAKLSNRKAPAPEPVKPAKRAPVQQNAPKDFSQMTPSEQRRHLIAIAQEAQKNYRPHQ